MIQLIREDAISTQAAADNAAELLREIYKISSLGSKRAIGLDKKK